MRSANVYVLQERSILIPCFRRPIQCLWRRHACPAILVLVTAHTMHYYLESSVLLRKGRGAHFHPVSSSQAIKEDAD